TVGAVLLDETAPLKSPALARPHHIILRPQFYREGTMPMRRPRPRPSARPLLWKELYVDSALPLHGPARPLGAVLLLGLVMSTCLIFLVSVLSIAAGESSGEIANAWTRIVGTIVACVLLLGVAVRAAGTFSGERERQTLDALLAAPLDNRSIVGAKWLASILSVRKGWWALGLIWSLGFVCGGLHFFGFTTLVLAWGVYAMFLAGVGVLCSLLSRTTLRATIWTVLIALGVNLLCWAAGLGWDLLAYLCHFRHNGWDGLATIAGCPPMTLE